MSEVACAVATFVAFIVGIAGAVRPHHPLLPVSTAAQVAMITEGVSKGTLPDDVYAAGKQAVKRRFVTASVYFALWSITKAITNQITASLNALGRVADAGSNAGPASTVAGIVSTVISVVLEYQSRSLGWCSQRRPVPVQEHLRRCRRLLPELEDPASERRQGHRHHRGSARRHRRRVLRAGLFRLAPSRR